jgi:hypothetical protein
MKNTQATTPLIRDERKLLPYGGGQECDLNHLLRNHIIRIKYKFNCFVKLKILPIYPVLNITPLANLAKNTKANNSMHFDTLAFSLKYNST